MRNSRPGETVSQFSDAQERIVGRFCTNCRIHRGADGGRELKTAHNRRRWVCKACADKYDRTHTGAT